MWFVCVCILIYIAGIAWCAFDAKKEWREKNMTNADKIRAMTDEELAWFIYTKTGCDHKCMHWKSKSCTDPDSIKVCGEVWLDWLKREAGDGT